MHPTSLEAITALGGRVKLLAQGLRLCKDICQRRVLHLVLGGWQRLGARVQLPPHPGMAGAKLWSGHELQCGNFDSKSLLHCWLFLEIDSVVACCGVSAAVDTSKAVLNSVELVRKR